MERKDFTLWSNRATEWGQAYLDGLSRRSVRPKVARGEIAAMLPPTAPDAPEPPEEIFADFERIVPGGMTHWQHPRFFAYFPSNASVASMVAEQLANTISAQCMLWQTSPAATEIEEVMVGWLRGALGLADHFKGVIHDSATTATLSAVLTMREQALGWAGHESGLSGQPVLRIYASAETHSSVDKAVRLAGIGQANLVKIACCGDFSMDVRALQAAIDADRAAGYLPAGVVICSGGTSIGAFDRVAAICAIARKEGMMSHVDAAWSGSAMICPEFRHLWDGVDQAGSIVFNPHKWLGAQFDCSVQFLADPAPQIRTLGLRPEYLRSANDEEIVNFNEWTVPLGRRFRALKLWFLMRAYGLEGLRTRIRNHVRWAEELAAEFGADPRFELTSPPHLALFTFACRGADADARTRALLERINDDGRVYLTQTIHQDRPVIRVSVGQFDCTRDDVMMVHGVARELVEA